MKGIKKRWFTLVELIVVITILSILWTISFMTFSWYSADARNVKRNSDLNYIKTKIELWTIKWSTLISFILDSSSIIPILSGNIQISWYTWSSLSWAYNAWNINYSALWLDPVKYYDPSTNSSYKIWITTISDKYELWATLEEWE